MDRQVSLHQNIKERAFSVSFEDWLLRKIEFDRNLYSRVFSNEDLPGKESYHNKL